MSNSSISAMSKKALLLSSLQLFYKDKNSASIVKEVIEGKTVLSLRVLDWLVTNYSRKNTVNYTYEGVQIYDIHSHYRNQLKAYSKKLFDPFCRRDRIKIPEISLETTIGQLNFFRWAIKTGVLPYACGNIRQIEEDMAESLQLRARKVVGKDGKDGKTEKTFPKRQRVVKNRPGFIRNFNPICISFN